MVKSCKAGVFKFMEEEERIRKALLKKALGYSADEVVEEYATDDDGATKLIKKKVTKKHFSPDISAIKVLFEKYYKTYVEELADMSDQELEKEKERLLQIIKEEEVGN
jgi:N-acetylglutamate synthase/N-acetylornithine aminotransferase